MKVKLLLLAGILCATACSSDKNASASSLGADSLVIGVGADEFGLKLNRARLGRYPLNAGICEPLLRLTADFNLVPGLATRWNYLGDNTYRFTLRKPARFHDGTPLTSASVGFTLRQGIAEKTQYSFLTDGSLRQIDDSTIDIRPSQPNLRVLEQMVHLSYAVVADGSNAAVHPVCTGPFRFAEYQPRNHISVDRNDTYWGEKAKLSRLTFRFIPDENTRALALKAGNVDVIFDVNPNMVATLRATRGVTVMASPPGAVIVMYIATHGKAPYTVMSDPRVRRAVAMSINRRALSRQIMEGYATEASTVNPPAVLGTFAALVHGIDYDLEGAKHLLDSAGWKSSGTHTRKKAGSKLVLTLISQPGNVDRSITEFIQAQLADAGIGTQIVELDAAAYENRLNSGQFDIDIEVPSQNDANPAFLLALRWYSRSNVRSAPLMFAGPRFDSLVEQSLASADRVIAQKFAAQAMHVLVHDEVAAIPLAAISRIYAMRSPVRGFVPHPSRLNQSWSGVWLEK